jgi:hypothetical protein
MGTLASDTIRSITLPITVVTVVKVITELKAIREVKATRETQVATRTREATSAVKVVIIKDHLEDLRVAASAVPLRTSTTKTASKATTPAIKAVLPRTNGDSLSKAQVNGTTVRTKGKVDTVNGKIVFFPRCRVQQHKYQVGRSVCRIDECYHDHVQQTRLVSWGSGGKVCQQHTSTRRTSTIL